MKTSELTGNSGELEKDLRDAAVWEAASPYESKLFTKAADELAAAQQVVEAAKNLVKVKGRHHSEIAMNRLIEAVAAMKGKE